MKALSLRNGRAAVALAVTGYFAALAPGAFAQVPQEAAAPQDAAAPLVQAQQVMVKGRKIAIGPHCEYSNLATVPLKSVDNQLLLKTLVDGNPATMVADTGTIHTMFTVEEANHLGLQLKHSAITTKDAQGNDQATYIANVKDISLDKFFWHHLDLGVAQNVAESYRELAGADILLNGYNKDIEFSVATGQVKFFVPSSECRSSFLAYWDDNAGSVPLGDLSSHDPREVVTVTVNGKELVALIDSGAPMSMIDLEAAARVGITPQSPGVTEVSTDFAARKHKGKAWVAPFASFSIGGETINNPKIGIADLWGPKPKDPEFQAAMRLASLGAEIKAPPGVVVANFSTIVSRVGMNKMVGTVATERPDMLLGADFLRSHHVLMAMSQHRLYYTYLGGKVFGYVDAAKPDDGAQAASGQ